jgi:hypothetical protein
MHGLQWNAGRHGGLGRGECLIHIHHNSSFMLEDFSIPQRASSSLRRNASCAKHRQRSFGVNTARVIAEKLNVDNGTGVAPARRIADRVSDLERKLLLNCFSIDHENDTLLPPTGFTHPGWMITSLMRCDVSRPRILQAPVATRAWPSLPFTLEGQPPK